MSRQMATQRNETSPTDGPVNEAQVSDTSNSQQYTTPVTSSQTSSEDMASRELYKLSKFGYDNDGCVIQRDYIRWMGGLDLVEPLKDASGSERYSDVGDARLLEAHFCQVLKHTPEYGWLVYLDGRWSKEDGYKWASRCTERVIREQAQEAAKESSLGTKVGETLSKHAHVAFNRIPKIVQAAEHRPRLSAHADEFDRDPLLLGVANGVVDLRTGHLRPHAPNLMLTKQSPVKFDPRATAPRWEQFLDEVFKGDKDLIRYVQKAIGYSMTGLDYEQVFFMLHGTGCNGKTTFLSTIGHVLGDHHVTLDPSELTTRKQRSETEPKLVVLKGARMVASLEPKEQADKPPVLDTGRIKGLTGGDPIQVRDLYKSPLTFRPTFKLWLGVNKLPTVPEETEGIWRRIRVIPFVVSFKGRADKNLEDKLKAEAPGILNWAIEGAMLWQKEGLGEAQSIQRASESYRQKQDPVHAFIQEELVPEVGAHVLQKEAHERYRTWARQNGEEYNPPVFSTHEFGPILEARDIRRRKTKNGQVLLDVRLKGPDEPQGPESDRQEPRGDEGDALRGSAGKSLTSSNVGGFTRDGPKSSSSSPEDLDLSILDTITVDKLSETQRAALLPKGKAFRGWSDEQNYLYARWVDRVKTTGLFRGLTLEERKERAMRATKPDGTRCFHSTSWASPDYERCRYCGMEFGPDEHTWEYDCQHSMVVEDTEYNEEIARRVANKDLHKTERYKADGLPYVHCLECGEQWSRVDYEYYSKPHEEKSLGLGSAKQYCRVSESKGDPLSPVHEGPAIQDFTRQTLQTPDDPDGGCATVTCQEPRVQAGLPDWLRTQGEDRLAKGTRLPDWERGHALLPTCPDGSHNHTRKTCEHSGLPISYYPNPVPKTRMEFKTNEFGQVCGASVPCNFGNPNFAAAAICALALERGRTVSLDLLEAYMDLVRTAERVWEDMDKDQPNSD